MKLFGSDYDGTFNRHGSRDENELEENMAAVAKWRATGNLFAFATGRSINGLTYDRHVTGIKFDYLIGLNGGIIVNAQDEIIFRELIEPAIAKKIVELIKNRALEWFSVTDGLQGYHPAVVNWRIDDELWHQLGIKETFSLPLEEALANPVAMIAVEMPSSEEAIAFASLVNETFAGHVSAFSNVNNVDIGASGLSKATGLAHIAKLHGIDENDVFGMGDSYNDVPMFETFHGFTLPEVNDEIKALADKVYPTVNAAIEDVI